MAAELSVFHEIVGTVDGRAFKSFGSILVPIKNAAIASGKKMMRKSVVIPALSGGVGGMAYPWVWAETDGFSLAAAFVLNGAGFVHASIRYNSPTSATDLTPTGTIHHWQTWGQSCVGVFQRDSERAYIHATAATAVGQSGSRPAVWTDPNRILGVADAISFFNEGAEDVEMDMFVISK